MLRALGACSLLALLVLDACASRPPAEGSPPPIDVPPTSSPNDGGADGAAPPCTANVDVDPNNCGHCGRRCDEGACNAGMCTPRVEVNSSAIPLDARLADVAIVKGRIYAILNVGGVGIGETRPLVRFDAGVATTLIANTTCTTDAEVLATNGDDLWVCVGRNVGSSFVRVDEDGKELGSALGYDFLRNVFVANEASALLAAEAPAMSLRLFANETITELGADTTWSLPALAGGKAFVVRNQTTLVHVASTSSTRDIEIPQTSPRGAVGTATALFAIGATSAPGYTIPAPPSVTRISLANMQPETSIIDVAELTRLVARTYAFDTFFLDTPEQAPAHDAGRVYFAITLTPPDTSSDDQGDVIVAWSKPEGFRPYAKTSSLAKLHPDRGGPRARLHVSNGRLYWLEVPAPDTEDGWRIVSTAL